MKKKVVLVVLCVVFAWLLWPSDEDRRQEAQQERAERARECFAKTTDFCGKFWCEQPPRGMTVAARDSYHACVNACRPLYSSACGRLFYGQ